MNDNLDLSKVLQELNSDLNYGLTKEEVDKRLKEYGSVSYTHLTLPTIYSV